MNFKKILMCAFLIALLAGCAAPTATTAPTATLQPTPADPSAAAVQAAVEALAYNMNLPADSIQVVSVEKVNWPDSCLGAGTGSMACKQVVTPGYKITLTAGGKNYEYHTNLDGSSVMLGSTSEAGGSLPPAAFSARQALSKTLGVKEDKLTIVRAAAVEWPDGCLGIYGEKVCSDIIVPGYLVILKDDSNFYEMHTNQSGSLVRLALRSGPSMPGPRLEVQDDAVCPIMTLDTATIHCSGGSSTATTSLSAARAEQLTHFQQTYSSFYFSTPAGFITFHGSGSQAATRAEARALAEWIRLSAAESNTQTSLSFNRQGGIAGFCDALQIERSGIAYVGSCNPDANSPLQNIYLNADQLELLYTWLDTLSEANYAHDDGAVADSMKVEMQFSGNGKQTPTNEQIQAMLDLCSQLAMANRTPK